jgi:hypothetical protein
MLVYGVGGIVWLARDWRHAIWNDVFVVAVFNLIGIVCEIAALRWIGGEICGRGKSAGR